MKKLISLLAIALFVMTSCEKVEESNFDDNQLKAINTSIDFDGKDNMKYRLSFIDYKPFNGLNKDVKFKLVKVEDTKEFTVKDYIIKMDPRMAGEEMGNHSSEGNIDPKYNKVDGLYHATISYSMGGNWTLNFIIKNNKNKIIAGSSVNCIHGSEVCDVNSKSTVALEVDVPN